MTNESTCADCGKRFTFEAPDDLSIPTRLLAPKICDDCAPAWRLRHDAESVLEELKLRGVPMRQRHESFDTFKPQTETQHKSLEAVRDHATDGVLLIGPPGAGKTHLAAAAIASGPRGSFFISSVDLLADVAASWRPGGGEGLMWRAKSAPLLALDDLGSESLQSWGMAALHALLDHRWNRSLPVIVTTNCSTATITERIGQPALSRLKGLCAHRITVKGPDMRDRKALAS